MTQAMLAEHSRRTERPQRLDRDKFFIHPEILFGEADFRIARRAAENGHTTATQPAENSTDGDR